MRRADRLTRVPKLSHWRESLDSIFAVSRGPKCRGTPRSFEIGSIVAMPVK
jgi:hypothetical protein